MVARDSRAVAIMFAFLLGFATIRAEEIPEGVMPKRQVVGTGVTTSSSTTSSSTTPVTSNSPTSNTPVTSQSTTSNDDTTTSQSQQTTSSTTSPTTVAVTTTNSDGSTITSSISTNTVVAATTKKSAVETSANSEGESVVKVGSTTINPSTLSHKTTIRQPLVTKETHLSRYTSYWTSDGQRFSSVYTTENVVASTTGFATATIAPGLADGGGNGSNLSNHSKSIIGGVVGGIGGAILIGGLAFVAWRLWGKKKATDDNDASYYQNDSQADSIQQQKRESMGTVLSGSAYSESGTNGLERYQNPGGNINPSSNF